MAEDVTANKLAPYTVTKQNTKKNNDVEANATVLNTQTTLKRKGTDKASVMNQVKANLDSIRRKTISASNVEAM